MDNKSRKSTIDGLQAAYDAASTACKKKAEPISKLTMSITNDDKQIELLVKLFNGPVSSVDSWHDYVFYCAKYKDSHKVAFVKLVNSLLRFLDYNANRNNQKLIDIMLLLVDLQKYAFLIVL